jgi:peptidoglycan/LPS O-acetylase OafA/YrhL
MKFRSDINGLRAIALLGVVLFHFLGSAISGGFSGVDVFFVISGYLMTSIIIGGLESGNFQLLEFFAARARRIIPALTVLCVTVLIIGWFYLHPLDFGMLGKHALSSLSFISNFVYLKETGYFDEASKEKWLLHTWSLSVEWQFYILYPIALAILHRFVGKKWLRLTLLIGALASFALCVYGTGRWPSSSFFLLPFRAWEMLVGGLAFLYPLKTSATSKKLLELLGIGMIFGAYWGLSASTAWPGYVASVPVIGAFFIIVAHRDRSWIMGNTVLQWIGKTSYSVYLWHWPVAVWLNYAGVSTDATWIAAGLALSFILGALSFYFVENPKARASLALSLPGHPSMGSIALFYGATLVSGLVIVKDGFASRLSQEYLAATDKQVMPRRENGYCFYDFNNDTRLLPAQEAATCELGARGQIPKLLLFGDSFAGHFEPFWDVLAKANGFTVNSVTTNWCAPIAGNQFDGPTSHPAYEQCLINRKALATDLGQYSVVVFSGQWSNGLKSGYLPEVIHSIRRAAAIVPTVIVMPPPVRYDTNVLKRFQRDLFYGSRFELGKYPKTLDAVEQTAHAQLRQGTSDLDNVIFIDRLQLFPASDMYYKSGMATPYSLDGMHITVEGSLISAVDFQRTEFYKRVIQVKLLEASAR